MVNGKTADGVGEQLSESEFEFCTIFETNFMCEYNDDCVAMGGFRASEPSLPLQLQMNYLVAAL